MTVAALAARRAHGSPPAPLLLASDPWFRALLVLGSGAVVGAAADVGAGAAVASALAVAVTLLVLARPVVAGYLVCALVPVTAGLQRGLVIPGLKISEALVAWLAATLLISCNQQWRTRWSDLDWALLAYVVLTFALGAYGLVRRGSIPLGDLGQSLGPAQFLLTFRLVLMTLRTSAERRRGLSLVLLGSAPVSLVTLCQQFDVGPVRTVLIRLTGATQAPGAVDPWAVTDRATGPFPHWFGLAGYLVVVVLVAGALLLARSTDVLPTRPLVAVVGLALSALVCTLTFVALGTAIAGLLALGWHHRRTALVLGIVMGGALAGQAVLGDGFRSRLAQQTSSMVTGSDGFGASLPRTLQFRLDLWRSELLPVVREHAAVGYGPGVPPGLSWQSTESLYVTLLLRGGIPLLLVYLLLLAAMWARAMRAARFGDRSEQVLGHALIVVLAVTSGMQLTSVLFTDAGYPHVLWLALALLGPAGRHVPLRPASRVQA